MSPPPGPPAASLDRYRQIVTNAISLLVAYALPRAITVIAIVVAARTLGAERFGQYGTAAALAVILSVVATLGMSPLLIRDIARAPERAPALIRAAHVLKSVSNLVMLVVLFVVARFVLDYPGLVVAAAMILGVAYAVGAYVENLAAYYQAVERMHVWAEASALYGLISSVVGVAVVVATRSVVWFCLGPLTGQIASLAWLLYRRRGTAPAVAWRRELGRLARELAPFAASFVVLTVYYKVDVVLLSRLQSATVVGIYTAGYKFVDVVQALSLVGIGAIYPRLARATHNRVHPDHPGTRLAQLAWVVMVPAAMGLLLLRTPVVLTAFGQEYARTVDAVAYLAVLLPLLSFSLLASYLLSAEARMWLVARAYLTALGANVVLNLALTPSLGAAGAAMAKLGSEICLAGAFWLTLRPLFRPIMGPRYALAGTLVAGVGGMLAWTVGQRGPWWAAGLLLVAVLVIYRWLGIIPTDWWSRVRGLVWPVGGAGSPEAA